ncbi:MAG: hypothetical protein KC418_16410 [Anaerolineales bacterium]|nr:hypothetical protein [Anaerolineales bacterium]MCB8951319.1 hypothetical protein [Ardenticatenales bacterium]
MNKFWSFAAGALCGALVGSATVVLLTPASGKDLIAAARQRWEDAISEGLKAMDARQKELEAEFERMKR